MDTPRTPDATTAAATTERTLRSPRPGEGNLLAWYADMALHGVREQKFLDGFATVIDKGNAEEPHVTAELTQRSTGRSLELTADPYLRVLDLGGRHAAGMIYSVQPLNWIGKECGAQLDDRAALTRRFVEINMLAVHHRHRRAGHASAMLADTEARYAAAGYTLAIVVVQWSEAPEMVRWYEARGYVFPASGTFPTPGNPIVQFRAGARHLVQYGAVNGGQIAGVKSLGGACTVRRLERAELLPGQKRPLPEGSVLTVGVLD